jgi:hypothetical protein
MVVRRIQTRHAEGVDVDAKTAALASYLGMSKSATSTVVTALRRLFQARRL